MIVIGVLLIIGYATDRGNPDKPGALAPSDTHSTFYADRACADFRVIVNGVSDHTMTTDDVIAKLGKMAANTQSAEDVDGVGWASLNLNTKQFRAAVVDGGDLSAAKANIDAITAICVSITR